MGKVYKHWSEFPMSKWRWKNFEPWEVACKDGSSGSRHKSLKIDEHSMDCLQRTREFMNAPLVITSAYRTPAYNARIGGAKKSQHIEAKAYDIVVGEHDPSKLLAAGVKAGFTSFGFYERQGFIHMDTRKRPARWGKKWFSDYKGSFDKSPKPVSKPVKVAVKPAKKPWWRFW